MQTPAFCRIVQEPPDSPIDTMHKAHLSSLLFSIAAVLWLIPTVATATDAVPKQVHLVVESSRLVASNIRLSRFDELKLNARERILDDAVGEAVIVVVTNQRIIGYGVLSGWRSVPANASEEVEEISAEDFAGLVRTNQRLLNFNGQSGVWAQRKRVE